MKPQRQARLQELLSPPQISSSIVPRALSFSFSPASPQHKEVSAEERAGTTNTVPEASASSQPSMSSLPGFLTSGIPMPKPLKLDNVAVHWKKFKRV